MYDLLSIGVVSNWSPIDGVCPSRKILHLYPFVLGGLVWFGFVFTASKHKDPDGGNIMAAFWIVGPVAGIVAAVACWFFLPQ